MHCMEANHLFMCIRDESGLLNRAYTENTDPRRCLTIFGSHPFVDLSATLPGRDRRRVLGAADKAANLERWKSFFCQLPVFGQIAYPVRAEATTHDKPGCKSLGCPAETFAAVGAIWEASKLGGLNIKKCLQPRELARGKIAFAETNGKPT